MGKSPPLFIGIILLIKHVLQSISIYHMIYVETPIDTTRYINMLFKDFLWGFLKDGTTRKAPLIAWHKLTQPWEKGGLGLKYCFTHAQALLRKWISKALDDPHTKWSLFLHSLLLWLGTRDKLSTRQDTHLRIDFSSATSPHADTWNSSLLMESLELSPPSSSIGSPRLSTPLSLEGHWCYQIPASILLAWEPISHTTSGHYGKTRCP